MSALKDLSASTPYPEPSRAQIALAERLHRCVDTLVLLAESSEETRTDLFQAAYLLRGLNRAGMEAVVGDIARRLTDPSLTDPEFLARARSQPAAPSQYGVRAAEVEEPSPQPTSDDLAGDEAQDRAPRQDGWFQRVFFARRGSETAAENTGAAPLDGASGAAGARVRANKGEAPLRPGAPAPSPAVPPPDIARRAGAVHVPPRPASYAVVPTPLTTARWESGTRSRMAARPTPEPGVDPSPVRPAPRPPASDVAVQPSAGRSHADSGMRRAVIAGVPLALSGTPATGWLPRTAARRDTSPPPPSPAAAAVPFRGRWELLRHFSSGSRPAASAPRDGAGQATQRSW